MQHPGTSKGQSSRAGKMSGGSGDDDLTSLSWLQTVNILPDSVASDDDQVPISPFSFMGQKFLKAWPLYKCEEIGLVGKTV